jgi:hypothetical protein
MLTIPARMLASHGRFDSLDEISNMQMRQGNYDYDDYARGTEKNPQKRNTGDR